MNEASNSAAKPRKPRQEGLKAELDARIAEAEWLKTHYDEQLRAAFAQVAALQARLRGQPEKATDLTPSERAELERLRSEARQLRAEVKRLADAEARYLDRIEELKEIAARDR